MPVKLVFKKVPVGTYSSIRNVNPFAIIIIFSFEFQKYHYKSNINYKQEYFYNILTIQSNIQYHFTQYSGSLLCFSWGLPCFSWSLLCFSLSLLCFLWSLFCFSWSLLYFSWSPLCYSGCLHCFSWNPLWYSWQFTLIL